MNIFKRISRHYAKKANIAMHRMEYNDAMALLRKARRWEERESLVHDLLIWCVCFALIGFLLAVWRSPWTM